MSNVLFSRTVLLDRRNQTWVDNVDPDVRHYLYPIHISKAFLFAPSLAASLYLLLLRFLDRQYASVFRMAESCVSDTTLSPEEQQIFDQISLLEDDNHPDAHACRLKITLATSASKEAMHCGWDPSDEMAAYVMKHAEVTD